MSVAELQVDADLETFADKDPWYRIVLDLVFRNPLGAAGALVVLIMIVMATLAEVIAPFDPELNEYERMLMGPNLINFFGTDQFGRDIFSRIVFGARTALFVGFISAFIGSTLGLILDAPLPEHVSKGSPLGGQGDQDCPAPTFWFS